MCVNGGLIVCTELSLQVATTVQPVVSGVVCVHEVLFLLFVETRQGQQYLA